MSNSRDRPFRRAESAALDHSGCHVGRDLPFVEICRLTASGVKRLQALRWQQRDARLAVESPAHEQCARLPANLTEPHVLVEADGVGVLGIDAEVNT